MGSERCGGARLVLPEEIPPLTYYSRAFASMFGSILFWLGSWNLLTESLSSRDEQSGQFFTRSGAREIVYSALGLFFLLITDTLYGNAGLRGGFLPPKKFLSSSVMVSLRCVFGLLGSVLFWTGTYDWLDHHTLPPSMERDVGYGLLGLVVLFCTGTFLIMAYIYPPRGARQVRAIVDHRSSICAQLFAILRCMLSIVGQNLVWLSVWNILESFGDSTAWREACYLMIGLFFFVTTNNFVIHEHHSIKENLAHSKGVYGDVISFKYHYCSLIFVLRSIFSLLSQVVLTVGAWSLLDQYAFVDSQNRNLIMATVGLLLLVGSGTLLQSAAITPLIAAFWQPDDAPHAPAHGPSHACSHAYTSHQGYMPHAASHHGCCASPTSHWSPSVCEQDGSTGRDTTPHVPRAAAYARHHPESDASPTQKSPSLHLWTSEEQGPDGADASRTHDERHHTHARLDHHHHHGSGSSHHHLHAHPHGHPHAVAVHSSHRCTHHGQAPHSSGTVRTLTQRVRAAELTRPRWSSPRARFHADDSIHLQEPQGNPEETAPLLAGSVSRSTLNIPFTSPSLPPSPGTAQPADRPASRTGRLSSSVARRLSSLFSQTPASDPGSCSQVPLHGGDGDGGGCDTAAAGHVAGQRRAQSAELRV
jgi:hypothetical protein